MAEQRGSNHRRGTGTDTHASTGEHRQDLSSLRNGRTDRKIRKATALSYEPGADHAPKIVAAGRGDVADRIVETARAADVPIYEDAHLADVLGTLKLGTEIPRELYEVVAEVLTFVSRMDEQALSKRRLAKAMGNLTDGGTGPERRR